MRGFAPADEILMFRQIPKTIFAQARPLWDPFATALNYMAAQLASLKQCSPNSQMRYSGLAAPEGRGATQETIQIFRRGAGGRTIF